MKFNIKYTLLLSIGVVIICLLTACSNTNFSKIFSEDIASEVEKIIANKDLKSSPPVKAKGYRTLLANGYNLLVDTVDAETVLEYKKINIPKKINDLHPSCIQLLDKSNLLIGLHVKNCCKEIGVYNFKENIYKTYFRLNQDVNDENNELFHETTDISAVNEKYIVFKLTKNNWENASVYLYDIENNILSKIYDYSIDLKTGRDVYMNLNSILIHNNNIYFDDFSYNEKGEIIVSLLKYDCVTKEITTVMKNAQNPMFYNDDIIFFAKNEAGKYKSIKSLMEKIHDVKIHLIEIKSNGKSLYCIENKHTDKEKLITEFQITELINHHNILYTTRGIGWLEANEHFVIWHDFEKNIPCIYSIDLDLILVFSDIPNGNNFFSIKDDYGLLFHSEDDKKEYYFFELKD